MKRPAGLIFAAIFLGFTAALLLLMSAGMVFTAASAASHGLPTPTNPAAPPPDAHTLVVLLGAMAVFFLLLTAWAVATIVGLLSLRKWARYSILTIGGLLTFFGLCSIAGLALMPSILAASQSQGAALPPGMMRGVLVFMGLFYSAIAAVGVWWLVYFNLRSVKAYFLPGYRQHALYPTAPPPMQRQSAASLATPGGLAEESYPYPPPPPYAMAAPGRFAHTPTSIIVIAILFFIAALTCASIALLPFPAFFFGFVLTGPFAPRLLYFAYAAAALAIGIGLLRLRNAARLGVYLFSLVGFLNILITLTPFGKARYAAYNALVQAQLHTAARPGLPPSFQQTILLVSLVVSVILYAVQIWLIERHRARFK